MLDSKNEIEKLRKELEIKTWSLEKTKENAQILYQELEKKNQELSELTAQLKKAHQDLTDFIFMASHDLQEPVRAITMSLEVMEFRKAKKDTMTVEDYEKYLSMIQQSAKHCQNLIQELLQYSRSGSQPVEMKKFNYGEMVKKVLHVLEPELQAIPCEITQDSLDCDVKGDRLKLERVLQNLLLNAIRYRRESPLRIHLSAKRQERDYLFSVEDNGVGIESQYCEAAFVPFKRLNRSVPGSGMGLAICRKVIERHGGKIWVESTPKQGSQFYFTLPLKPIKGEAKEKK